MLNVAGRFNPVTQGLDIVELGAVFRCLPDSFSNDSGGLKKHWKRSIEECFKEMYAKFQNDELVEHRRRNGAYKNQTPNYGADSSVHSFKSKLKIQKKRASQNSLSLNDKRAALEKSASKPLLPSKAFL